MTTQLTIRGRESLLNRILGIDPTGVLNPPGSGPPVTTELMSSAEDLKENLNHLKSKFITENGRWVDYSGLAGSIEYQQYRSLAASLDRFNYRSLNSLEEQLAFWINLYNALVIDAVIQEGVRGSVTQSWLGVLGFFQKAAYLVNGHRFSLTDIEHGILRDNRGIPYFPGTYFSEKDQRSEALPGVFDHRIHFALNCASRSCPPIGVYNPDNIFQQLDLAAHSFINVDSQVDYIQKTISISRIFRWYEADFGGKNGVKEFISRYLQQPTAGRGSQGEYKRFRLIYHLYDWKLNNIKLDS
jgi:hypothetical protein